jgi:hypothetical protein
LSLSGDGILKLIIIAARAFITATEPGREHVFFFFFFFFFFVFFFFLLLLKI